MRKIGDLGSRLGPRYIYLYMNSYVIHVIINQTSYSNHILESRSTIPASSYLFSSGDLGLPTSAAHTVDVVSPLLQAFSVSVGI